MKWQTIDSAPKDDTHIRTLVLRSSSGPEELTVKWSDFHGAWMEQVTSEFWHKLYAEPKYWQPIATQAQAHNKRLL